MSAKNTKVKLNVSSNPSSELVRVHKIVGQLKGVEKMMSEQRTAPQILQQVQAAISGLNSLKIEVLKRYLNECLEESEQSGKGRRLVEQVLEIVRIQMRK